MTGTKHVRTTWDTLASTELCHRSLDEWAAHNIFMQHGALGQVQTNVILDRTTGRHRTIANSDFVSGRREKTHKSIMAAGHRTSSCNISVSDMTRDNLKQHISE